MSASACTASSPICARVRARARLGAFSFARHGLAAAAALACAATVQAHPHSPAQVQQSETTQLETVNVQGSRRSQLGVAESANSGVVTQQQIESRTAYRPGEVLEVVPGLVVTQHSGEGKANQFY
ncbi:MAG: hypothetical protein ACKOCJ_11420, partial [Burkholderiaceae bacterium]